MENVYKMKVLSLVEKVYPVVGGVDMLGVKKTYREGWFQKWRTCVLYRDWLYQREMCDGWRCPMLRWDMLGV